MVKNNNNEKQKEKKENLIDNTLEDLLIEKNIRLSPGELNSNIEKVKLIYKLESTEAAREYLREKVITEENLDKFFNQNKLEIQNNYNEKVLGNLKQLKTTEKQYYDALIEPFIDETFLDKGNSFRENISLFWYKFTNKLDKHNKLYSKINNQKVLTLLKGTQDQLHEKLNKFETLIEKYNTEILKKEEKSKSLYQTLKSASDDIEEAEKILPRIKNEKQKLEKEISENKKSEQALYQDVEKLKKIKRDIDITSENTVKTLEKSNHQYIKFVDAHTELEEKKQLKNFYTDITNTYEIRVETLSDLIIKMREGLNFNTAYEEAKDFVERDKSFNKYDSIRKKQLEQYTEKLCRFSPPYIRDDLTLNNHSKKELDYELLIGQGAKKLKKIIDNINYLV